MKVHPTAVVDAGATIGNGTAIWHFCHISEDTVIGEGCSFGQNVYVAPGVRVGNNCKIQNNVSLYTGVELADDVFCGPSMVFTNVLTPRCEFPKTADDGYLATKVHRGASIGANATIVCGHDIGAYAFIAAGAVVVAHVPRHALMAGVPARQIGWACRCGQRINEALACMACDRTYEERDDGLHEVTA